LGCGTLGGPSGFRTGNLCASSTNGRQHSLPKNAAHQLLETEDVKAHWTAEQTRGPSRLWGQTKPHRLGGEIRVDSTPELWTTGEYWNVDSNIRIWGEHETRRNAAEAAHDVHRHDQITRIVLPASPGSGKPGRQCVSGVVSADCCFLEAWGFDLGLRDRQASPATLWRPPGGAEMFRAERSFIRNTGRMAESFRTLRKSSSLPASPSKTKQRPAIVTTLKPEDIGGEAGDLAAPEDAQLASMGRTHGSRSCQFWDRFDHAAKREAAKLALSVHSPTFNAHPAHPMKDHMEMQPAAVYTRKYKQSGEDALRRHVTASERAGRKTARTAAGRTLRLATTL